MTGNYLPAWVPASVQPNRLTEGIAARDEGGALIFDEVEPVSSSEFRVPSTESSS
ncbi:MAG: hypothetical protein P8Y94_13465 [Acidobacteriota bacterium]